VPGENRLELFHVEDAGFDELEKAGFVLGATGLERDGGQMFRSEHARQCAFDIFLDG